MDYILSVRTFETIKPLKLYIHFLYTSKNVYIYFRHFTPYRRATILTDYALVVVITFCNNGLSAHHSSSGAPHEREDQNAIQNAFTISNNN